MLDVTAVNPARSTQQIRSARLERQNIIHPVKAVWKRHSPSGRHASSKVFAPRDDLTAEFAGSRPVASTRLLFGGRIRTMSRPCVSFLDFQLGQRPEKDMKGTPMWHCPNLRYQEMRWLLNVVELRCGQGCASAFARDIMWSSGRPMLSHAAWGRGPLWPPLVKQRALHFKTLLSLPVAPGRFLQRARLHGAEIPSRGLPATAANTKSSTSLWSNPCPTDSSPTYTQQTYGFNLLWLQRHGLLVGS